MKDFKKYSCTNTEIRFSQELFLVLMRFFIYD